MVGMPCTSARNFRLDGRAVQGAGFRHQSLRRRGFESHSNQRNPPGFFFGLNIIIFNPSFFSGRTTKTKVVARAIISSELAQRKRVGLITQRSQDRNLDSLMSRLAQLVERKTLNLVVVGSSPTVGVPFYFCSLFFIFSKKKNLCHSKRHSPTGNRTRVVWVKTTYPDQLDYRGCAGRESNPGLVRGRDVYYHCTTGAQYSYCDLNTGFLAC